MFHVPLLPGRKDNPLWSGFIERPFEALSGPLRRWDMCQLCGKGGKNSALLDRSGGNAKAPAGVYYQSSCHEFP